MWVVIKNVCFIHNVIFCIGVERKQDVIQLDYIKCTDRKFSRKERIILPHFCLPFSPGINPPPQKKREAKEKHLSTGITTTTPQIKRCDGNDMRLLYIYTFVYIYIYTYVYIYSFLLFVCFFFMSKDLVPYEVIRT